MATFATGKYALAICDRCGQQYKCTVLKKEWNGLMTCTECWEPKHPQLEKKDDPTDPEALPWTRTARKEPVTVYVNAPGDSSFSSEGMKPSSETKKLLISTRIGNVSVSTS